MSELLSPEREALYRDLGLEELLQDPEPRKDPNQPFVVDERTDAFGNEVVLVWDPEEQLAHVSVAGIDIPTSGEKAGDAIHHPYPLLHSKIGATAVYELIGITEAAEAKAA